MERSILNPQPEREECAYKRLLIDDIKAAINELLKIHTDEFEAVLNGNYDTSSMTEERLRMAREQKALLIERYREHVIGRRC
jgi:hypothetical protein